MDLLLRDKEHDRIIVSNDPVNLIDPWGLDAARDLLDTPGVGSGIREIQGLMRDAPLGNSGEHGGAFYKCCNGDVVFVYHRLSPDRGAYSFEDKPQKSIERNGETCKLIAYIHGHEDESYVKVSTIDNMFAPRPSIIVGSKMDHPTDVAISMRRGRSHDHYDFRGGYE